MLGVSENTGMIAQSGGVASERFQRSGVHVHVVL